MKKLFLLLAVIITFALSAAAQDRTISGEVVSADNGEPLMGATVMGVGSKIGVVTDLDGNFSITLPASVKKLSVSYVGMNTLEVDITASPMTIKLENSNMLDEVITVAYGTAKRSSFTGSASVLDASKIESVQVTNPVDALSGRVAGVQLNSVTGAPGSSSPTIFIRGISSINAGNDPLIVLDGTPFSGDLNTIASQDIESMTVLKDAASNALYGARGANGVILITTKKGKGEAKVTFDAKWGQNSRAVSDYDVISSPKGYYEAYATAIANSQSAKWGLGGKLEGDALNAYVNKTLLNDLAYNVYNVPDGQTLINNGYYLNPNATLGNVVTTEDGRQFMLTPDNWSDYAYKKALRQEYNLSVAQSTDKSNFYFSANYLNNEGISPNSGFERFTGRLTADIQAKPWLKIGANASYSHYLSKSLGDDGQSASTGNVFGVASTMPPIYPLYVRDGEGNIMTDANGIQMMDYGSGDNAGLQRPVLSDANPIQANLLDVNKANGNAFNGNAFAEIRFLNDFKFTTNNALSLDETRYNQVTNPFYGMYADQNGSLSVEHDRVVDWTFQQLLNWTRSFGDHNVSVLLGHENYVQKTYVLYAMANNMLLPSNTELSGAITSGSNGSSRSEYNNEGYFARANYDYDGKYFASASFRRDASSRFHPDHRWGSFWSFGAAWIISKEKFFDAPWVDILKLKASYGEQGNDRIGSYRYTNTYKIVNSNGTPAAEPNTMGNPNITWEKGGNFNGGVDFSFWGDRLGGTIEGFYRKTTDMLFTIPLPPTYGYRSYYANVGDMTNAGVEIDLHGDLYRSKDITISMNANLTHYRNKITRLAPTSKQQTCDGVDGYSSGTFYYGEGESLYTFRMPTYAGVDAESGQPTWWMQVNNPDGTTSQVRTTDYTALNTTNDYHLQGTALPKVYGGFGVSGTIYGFDFAVDFNYQIGGKVYDSTYAGLMSAPTSTSVGAFHKDVLKGWTPDNKSADLPRLVYGDLYNSRSSSFYLTNAGYLSLRSINAGYTLPTKWTKKFQVDRIRLYCSADNVAIWSKRKGLDPRQAMSNGLDSTGAKEQAISGSSSSAYYSPIRTISGGINVTF